MSGEQRDAKNSYGFIVREAFLRELGKAFTKWIGPPDLVARVEGDLFAVLRSNITSEEGAADAGARLQALLAEPIDVYGHSIDANAHVVTVFAPRDGNDAEQLFHDALKQRSSSAAN